MPKRSLRTRIAAGLAIYSLMLATVIIGVGYSVHESLELLVWRAQLDGEISSYLSDRARNPDTALPQSGKLRAYLGKADSIDIPSSLRQLGPGIHDDVNIDGRESAVMVRELDGERIYMTIDIGVFETEEKSIAHVLLGLSLFGAAGLVLTVWWLSGRMLQPVTDLAQSVDRLQPGEKAERIAVSRNAATEVESIASAMNRLLDRMDTLVERERGFVHTASHELRTPIAVIAGAAQLALDQTELPAATRKPLLRIRSSAAEMEQLIHMLLVLAKSPERLHASAQVFSLDELLAEIVEDHRHLLRDKTVSMDIGNVTPSSLQAPLRIAQIAIANLIRNAIQHTDHGSIRILVEPAGVLQIHDSGHGTQPEDVSRRYLANVRGEREGGSGIGLALIIRICSHLDWDLLLDTSENGGTVAILDLRASLTTR